MKRARDAKRWTPTCPRGLSRWERPENLQHAGLSLDLFERGNHRAIGDVTGHLYVEEVVPGFPRHGARLDCLQVDAPLREMPEDVEQGARLVVQAEEQ